MEIQIKFENYQEFESFKGDLIAKGADKVFDILAKILDPAPIGENSCQELEWLEEELGTDLYLTLFAAMDSLTEKQIKKHNDTKNTTEMA